MTTAVEKVDLFEVFNSYTILELKALLNKATDREESIFYSKVLSLKLGLAQEKVIGKELFVCSTL
ncbi:MAG: hypothetical protein FWB74_01180 [Defluviitaleaceae bacterium]|nr:hypothetical protein [Defluviitaleaceae bacterium]